MSTTDIFAILSDFYTLSNGETIRCSFIDLGDGTAYIGAMFEHSAYGPNILKKCPLNKNCVHNENDVMTGEASLLYRWSLTKITQHRIYTLPQSYDGQSYLLMTCNKDVTLAQDYMLLPFHNDFITTNFNGNTCYTLTKGNIRGYGCENSNVNLWK